MPNPSVDANARHQLYVERLAATNANTLNPELKALAAYVRARLAAEGSTIPSKRVMREIIRDVKAKFSRTYDKWQNQTGKFLNGLADYETQFQTTLLDKETTDDFTPVKPTNKSAKDSAKNTPLTVGANGGAVALNTMVGNFSKTETKKATALIEAGFYNGSSTSEIAASIAGTRKNRFKDGIMVNTKSNATAISKTGASHVSNNTKGIVYDENERAVKGWIVTAVLDNRTSKICRGLDGTRVARGEDFKEPPYHFNCRTVKRPWLREDLDAIKGAERETIGASGEEFEGTGKQYYTWLKEQPAWFQDDILGGTEGKIFRNAGLTPQQFKTATIKRDGTPLTIDEMAQKDSKIAEYLADGK